MPSISVIVPVYQAEKFLRDCVESVRRQTFSDWELLLVDDGVVGHLLLRAGQLVVLAVDPFKYIY